MSLKEMIFSEEFGTYRRAVIKEIVAVLKTSLKTDPVVQAQYEIARRLLNVPSNILNDPELNNLINTMLKKDFERVYVELARQGILEKEE